MYKLLRILMNSLIGMMIGTFIALVAFNFLEKSNISDEFKSEVMITNLIGTSGGSGVIVNLANSKSEIMTNAHVCEVIKDGGFVFNGKNKAMVVSYIKDTIHDLCLVEVNRRFWKSVKIAENPPELFDNLKVVGHPKLLPTIRNYGHLSGRQMITVLVDIKKCTDSDLEKFPLFCIFLGGMPIVKAYEADATSLLTQPGSSGSGVLNENNELIGLIFAGSGDMSYGFIVPYEYVINFYSKNGNFKNVEKRKVVDYTKSAENSQEKNNLKTNMVNYCKNNSKHELTYICDLILKTINWRIL